MAQVTLNGLTKRFGGRAAIDGLDMEIADGELLALLGPSGCGKTTTLNCIAGLEKPDGGRILFDGEDVTATEPHQRNIAMVFQSALLYPHLNCRDNIAMSLRRTPLDAEARRAKIDAAAAMLEIEDLMDRRPSEISGGQRQRVATAKALVRDPAAFLLDEPLSALDAALRTALRAELVNLQKRLGTTMVFVTHDQTEAMTMGDRIAVMRNAQVEQVDTPGVIYDRPASLFVARFVGTPPMNAFPGRLDGNGGVFACGPLRLTVRPDWPLPRGDRMVACVRPHDMEVDRHPRENALPARVFALEHMGRENLLIARSDALPAPVNVVVPPDWHAAVGDTVHLAVPRPVALVFADDGTVA